MQAFQGTHLKIKYIKEGKSYIYIWDDIPGLEEIKSFAFDVSDWDWRHAPAGEFRKFKILFLLFCRKRAYFNDLYFTEAVNETKRR